MKYIPDSIKRVAVIAPAGNVQPERLSSGIKLIESWGVEVITAPELCKGDELPHLSGSLKSRLNDLMWAFSNSGADAVWCARGGCGSAQLLPYINYNVLRSNPLPLIGYSDICALQLGLLKNQAISSAISSTMVAKLPELFACPAQEQELMIHSSYAALGGKNSDNALIINSITQFNSASQRESFAGKALALNLTVLTTLCGTNFIPDMSDRVIILEDLNEPLYKIDRMLTQLQQSGIFSNVAGVVFGQFSGCARNEEERQLLKIIFERFLISCALPGRMDFPLGHDFPTLSLSTNQTIEVSEDKISIF